LATDMLACQSRAL